MKTIYALLICVSMTATVFGSLITKYDTHLTVGFGGITVQQHPTNGDYTGYGFDVIGSMIETHGTFLDEGCSVWYRSLDSSYSYEFSRFGGETYDVGYGQFYFDVSTSGWYGEDEQSYASGWALVENSPATGLSMLHSEMTYDVVPEPSSALLMLVAGAGGWMFRRKLRR